MTPLIIGLIVLAILALIVVTASFRKRDTNAAIGQLSDATVRRDQGGRLDAKASPEGQKVEASAHAGTDLVAAEHRPPAVYVPPDPETLGVTRRQFLNRSILASFIFAISGFGAAVIAQLWPKPTEGFGAKINVGKISDIEGYIAAGSGFYYYPEGRMWITEYPAQALVKAQSTYSFYDKVEQGLNAGVVALFQTCPHLGCRVPDCATSQWFECPCHGSQYNRVGEKKGGPAPRGMDRFPMTVSAANELIVDTGNVIQGPPIGVNTTGQEAEGPHCLSSGGGH